MCNIPRCQILLLWRYDFFYKLPGLPGTVNLSPSLPDSAEGASCKDAPDAQKQPIACGALLVLPWHFLEAPLAPEAQKQPLAITIGAALWQLLVCEAPEAPEAQKKPGH
ncbi:MAG: hypothetical protein AAFO94_07945, partial [Bacteroidota bacterium]